MSTKPEAEKTVIVAVDYDFKGLSGEDLMAFASRSTKTSAKIEKAKVDVLIEKMISEYNKVVNVLNVVTKDRDDKKDEINELKKKHVNVVQELDEKLKIATELKDKTDKVLNETMANYMKEHDASVAAVARMEGMRETMQTIFAVPTIRESLQRRVLADGTLQEDKRSQQS